MSSTKTDHPSVTKVAIITGIIVWVSQSVTFGSVMEWIFHLPLSWRFFGAIALASFLEVLLLAIFFYLGIFYLVRVLVLWISGFFTHTPHRATWLDVIVVIPLGLIGRVWLRWQPRAPTP